MRAEPYSQTTRPPAVSGMFYPGNPDRLRTDVRDLLAEVAPPRATPKALIAPHAGYIYSGGVAAAAFATLRDSAHAIKRVVLIGPAHYVPVPGIAVPTVSSFETPLVLRDNLDENGGGDRSIEAAAGSGVMIVAGLKLCKVFFRHRCLIVAERCHVAA